MPQYVETNFDERSGYVTCKAPWGTWWQSVAEVHIEVNVPNGTRSNAINVTVKPSHICVIVAGKVIIQGNLYSMIVSDEMIWTLEDRRLIHIVMTKADAHTKKAIWEGLLLDNYLGDPWTINEMRKKFDLECYQIENPGLDFSEAKLDKCYDEPPGQAMQRMLEAKQKAKNEGNGASSS